MNSPTTDPFGLRRIKVEPDDDGRTRSSERLFERTLLEIILTARRVPAIVRRRRRSGNATATALGCLAVPFVPVIPDPVAPGSQNVTIVQPRRLASLTAERRQRTRTRRLQSVELLAEHLIPLDRIAADALIDARRHAGEIRDLRLQPRTPVANAFAGAEQRRRRARRLSPANRRFRRSRSRVRACRTRFATRPTSATISRMRTLCSYCSRDRPP